MTKIRTCHVRSLRLRFCVGHEHALHVFVMRRWRDMFYALLLLLFIIFLLNIFRDILIAHAHIFFNACPIWVAPSQPAEKKKRKKIRKDFFNFVVLRHDDIYSIMRLCKLSTDMQSTLKENQ